MCFPLFFLFIVPNPSVEIVTYLSHSFSTIPVSSSVVVTVTQLDGKCVSSIAPHEARP